MTKDEGKEFVDAIEKVIGGISPQIDEDIARLRKIAETPHASEVDLEMIEDYVLNCFVVVDTRTKIAYTIEYEEGFRLPPPVQIREWIDWIDHD